MNNLSIPENTARLVESICKEMILHPEKLRVQVAPMRQSFTIYIEANLPDSKRIVGSMGSHFNSIKALVQAIARKHGQTAVVDSVQSVGKITTDQFPPYKPSDKWPKAKVLNLFGAMARAAFVHDDAVKIEATDGPNFSTNIDILVSQSEDKQLVSDMLAIFKILMRPIGKSNHRNLMLNIVADVEHEAQPDAADGRHMRQLQ